MDREEAKAILDLSKLTAVSGRKYDEAIDMAIEALSAEQKEEDLAKDIARRMATIIENEQDMRVILKNASAEQTDLISREGVSAWLSNMGHDKLASAVMDTRRFPPECAKGGDAEIPSTEQYPYMKQSPNNGADLISRADAIEAVENLQTEQWIDSDIDYNNGLQSAIAEIKAFPSADRPTELLKDGTLKVNVNNGAEVNRVLVWGDDGCGGLYYADDRPSGEWICKDSADMSVYWFECSECGEKTPRDNFNHEYKSNYCPNCGAKMGGK